MMWGFFNTAERQAKAQQQMACYLRKDKDQVRRFPNDDRLTSYAPPSAPIKIVKVHFGRQIAPMKKRVTPALQKKIRDALSRHT